MYPEIKKSGLTIKEFGELVGVTRIAVHNWMAGRSKPHSLIAARVTAAKEFLTKQVNNGRLPLDTDITRPQRNEKIDKLKTAFDKYCAA